MPWIPPVAKLLPPPAFNALIADVGQQMTWMKGHTCPCVFGGGGPQGKLPVPGSPARGCKQCFGVGTYWDAPSPPFRGWISYMHMSPTPDEPGVRTDPAYGTFQMSEPSLTIPYINDGLPPTDPSQPTTVWQNASVDDMFVPLDMLARYTATLQNGINIYLPYQQNVKIAPSGAVNIWDPVNQVLTPVSGYVVSGVTVALPAGYAEGLNYMVEFQAAPLYVAYRSAGGLPHVRPFGGGSVNEPRRFRLQSLDFWTRLRSQPPTSGSVGANATVPGAFGMMTGRPV